MGKMKGENENVNDAFQKKNSEFICQGFKNWRTKFINWFLQEPLILFQKCFQKLRQK